MRTAGRGRGGPGRVRPATGVPVINFGLSSDLSQYIFLKLELVYICNGPLMEVYSTAAAYGLESELSCVESNVKISGACLQ